MKLKYLLAVPRLLGLLGAALIQGATGVNAQELPPPYGVFAKPLQVSFPSGRTKYVRPAKADPEPMASNRLVIRMTFQGLTATTATSLPLSRWDRLQRLVVRRTVRLGSASVA